MQEKTYTLTVRTYKHLMIIMITAMWRVQIISTIHENVKYHGSNKLSPKITTHTKY